MDPYKLFHFDIKTLGNYGDTILFEMVRETFNSFSNREAFYFEGSTNLRDAVYPRLVSAINDKYDAVVIGGGGLFLSDTNPNQKSGWQWNCSIELLRAIEKPIIVFAVGNNRFLEQADFSEKFIEHVNLLAEKSIFFGLRNRGSVETIKEYLRPELRHKVVYQPCPTTISSKLCPDLYVPDLAPSRHLGVQALIGKRQLAAGFDKPGIYDETVKGLKALKSKGWDVEVFANARGDLAFHNEAVERGLDVPLKNVYQTRQIFQAMNYFAKLPLTVGMRGHAQMIPFGLGNPILSLFVHNKLRWFLRDIGLEELCIDVRQKNFADEIVDKSEWIYNNFADLRVKLMAKQDEMLQVTMNNLADIHHALGGKSRMAAVAPYSKFERKLAQAVYLAGFDREELVHAQQAAKAKQAAAR
ncbi:polysaccharide pyruvyl transferase family protein [Sphingobium sp. Z007]|uniref:polysaccharide pyruvyl transferase family protein n=1 Tax=Sphingobium sp. Z007 TaxID=627495 RepID=UPI000B49702D|nr:polysaccharide pyruvyl transferase family protein [Sphingobium sp. Z007]